MFRYILFILVFFSVLEVVSRIIFPNFNYNNIHYEIDSNHKVIKGIDHYVSYLDDLNNVSFRVEEKYQKIKLNDNKNKIFFLGDSVTLGFGVGFQDTYFQKLNDKNNKYQILAASNLGVSSKDIFRIIDKNLTSFLNKGDTLIYQFNFNDITIRNQTDIKNRQIKDNESYLKNKLNKFANYTQKIRFQYLSHSTFFKILQHYASLQTKKLKGDCLERSKHAIGMYTFSYFSEGYKEISEKLWNEFESELINTKEILKSKNINFYILISPISLQLKNHGAVNKLKLDINCSTKNGRNHLIEILKSNQIEFVDPLTEFLKYEKENETILFHEFDTNHPNEIGHSLISESLNNFIKN